MRFPGWAKPIVACLFVIAGAAVVLLQMQRDESTLRLGGQEYQVAVMRTDEELQRGLSGTDTLATNQAMIFVFARDAKWPIWMKDMNYPIDIVWLDNDRRVVHTVSGAQPSSYPGTEFVPAVASRYVIELSNGTVERLGIKKGDLADLPAGV